MADIAALLRRPPAPDWDIESTGPTYDQSARTPRATPMMDAAEQGGFRAGPQARPNVTPENDAILNEQRERIRQQRAAEAEFAQRQAAGGGGGSVPPNQPPGGASTNESGGFRKKASDLLSKGKEFFSSSGEEKSFLDKAKRVGKLAGKVAGGASLAVEGFDAATDPNVRAFLKDDNVSLADKARFFADRGLRVAGGGLGGAAGGAVGFAAPVPGGALMGGVAGGFLGQEIGDALMDDPMQKYEKYRTPAAQSQQGAQASGTELKAGPLGSKANATTTLQQPAATAPQQTAAAASQQVATAPKRELLDQTNPKAAAAVMNKMQNGGLRLADLRDGEGYITDSSGNVTAINNPSGVRYSRQQVPVEVNGGGAYGREADTGLRGPGGYIFHLANQVRAQRENARQEKLAENRRQADQTTAATLRGQDVTLEGHQLTADTARARLRHDMQNRREDQNVKLLDSLFPEVDKDGKSTGRPDASKKAAHMAAVQESLRASGVNARAEQLDANTHSKFMQLSGVKQIADDNRNSWWGKLNKNGNVSTNLMAYRPVSVEKSDLGFGQVVVLENGIRVPLKELVGGGGLLLKDPVDLHKLADLQSDIDQAVKSGREAPPDDRRWQTSSPLRGQ